MSITVSGVQIRADEMTFSFEIPFDQLTEEGQKRLFSENKNIFLIDAINSNYESVRNMVNEFMGQYSSETVNTAIYYKMNNSDYIDLILKFLKSDFVLEDSIRNSLSKSHFAVLRYAIAEDPKTSTDILKNLFSTEVFNYVVCGLQEGFKKVISNPNFVFDDELDYILKKYYTKERDELVKSIKEANSHIS